MNVILVVFIYPYQHPLKCQILNYADYYQVLLFFFTLSSLSLLYFITILFGASQVVKNLPTNAGAAGDIAEDSLGQKLPWSRKWQLTPVFLPGKSKGKRTWTTKVQGVAKSRPHLIMHVYFIFKIFTEN